jgi:hypothetical protein
MTRLPEKLTFLRSCTPRRRRCAGQTVGLGLKLFSERPDLSEGIHKLLSQRIIDLALGNEQLEKACRLLITHRIDQLMQEVSRNQVTKIPRSAHHARASDDAPGARVGCRLAK